MRASPAPRSAGGGEAAEAPLELAFPAGRRGTGETLAVGSTPGRRLAASLALAALFTAVGLELLALLSQHLSAPTEADWHAAADHARSLRRAREPILFAPHWVDPIGRAQLGEELGLDLLSLSDVDRYPRVLELSIRGARHPFLAGLAPKETRDFGGVKLSIYEKPAVEVSYDFVSRVAEAIVERVPVTPEGRLVRCSRQGRYFLCDPAQGWNRVGATIAEVEHWPYRCIFAHAVDGHIMRVAFPSVELGTSIVGYTGIDDFENHKRAKNPVRLRVRVGPRPPTAILHESDNPWTRFTVDTTAMAGQTHEVRFEVQAEGSAYARAFCFAAEVRR
jgi:hypothetical protein